MRPVLDLPDCKGSVEGLDAHPMRRSWRRLPRIADIDEIENVPAAAGVIRNRREIDIGKRVSAAV